MFLKSLIEHTEILQNALKSILKDLFSSFFLIVTKIAININSEYKVAHQHASNHLECFESWLIIFFNNRIPV